MAIQIFKDKHLQSQMEQWGFVKVPFWSSQIVELVNRKFDAEFKDLHISSKKFHTTYETTNVELINKVKTFLQPFFLEATEPIFYEMSPISASFLIKEYGSSSESPLHQDASFVDEPLHQSVSVWVALKDIDKKNGCLQFVPGSHKLFNKIRYLPYSNSTVEPFEKLLLPYLSNLTIQSGEAFIFFNSVLHASPRNQTEQTRLVALMGFYSKTARLSLFIKNENEQRIDRYAITVEELAQINAEFKPMPDQIIGSQVIPKPVTFEEAKRFVQNTYSVSRRARAFASRLLQDR